MITPDALLDIAVNTSDWVLRDQAFLAGLTMENRGISETALIGPFSVTNGHLKGGDTVVIKKGSEITSTSKRLNRKAGRDYKVTLKSVDTGSIYRRQNNVIIVNSRVVWTSDGYWCYTDISNVTMCG